MVTLKVRKVGNSLGVILPQSVLDELNLAEGGEFTLTKSPEGFRLTSYDPDFKAKMEIAREGMAKYRNTLRELAK